MGLVGLNFARIFDGRDRIILVDDVRLVLKADNCYSKRQLTIARVLLLRALSNLAPRGSARGGRVRWEWLKGLSQPVCLLCLGSNKL